MPKRAFGEPREFEKLKPSKTLARTLPRQENVNTHVRKRQSRKLRFSDFSERVNKPVIKHRSRKSIFSDLSENEHIARE